jgi:hypothetical protein
MYGGVCVYAELIALCTEFYKRGGGSDSISLAPRFGIYGISLNIYH